MNYERAIINLLKQAGNAFDKNIRQCMCDCSLTIPQSAVITILNQNGDMKISDISSRAGFTNSTTSGIIDRLEKMGLVQRVRQEEDRRVVKVSLTQKAGDMNYDLDIMLESYFANLFSRVSEDDLKAVIIGLEIFNRILKTGK